MLINQLDDEIIKNLSQSELYILHYVYDHPDEVIDMSKLLPFLLLRFFVFVRNLILVVLLNLSLH